MMLLNTHLLILFQVYRDAQNDQFREYYGANRVSQLSWHSDVVCPIIFCFPYPFLPHCRATRSKLREQPFSSSLYAILALRIRDHIANSLFQDQPTVGGDTLFVNQVEAYNRLSPEFKKRLEGLKALHSAVPQADHSRQRGGPVRREPIETEHPLVREVSN